MTTPPPSENSLVTLTPATQDLHVPNRELALAIEMLTIIDVRSTFRFMDLPPELRLIVYEMLLKANHIIQPPGFPKGPFALPRPYLGFLQRPSLSIEVLMVNRQIHAEAIQVLYGTNTFQLEFPNDSQWAHMTSIFLKHIGPSNRARICKAELFFAPIYDVDPDHKHIFPRRSIRSFSNMREVDLIVAKSQAFDNFRRNKGDKDYLRGTVELLRRHLPDNCRVRWDVSGHIELESILKNIYGEGGYLTVETETKKMMVKRVKALWQRYPASWKDRWATSI